MPDDVLDAALLAGLLGQPDRRQVFAAVELGARSLDAVVEATGLAHTAAAKALGRLVQAGVLGESSEGIVVDAAALSRAARAARDRGPSTAHHDQPESIRKVLTAFVADGRLTSIPTARSKRLVVLDWLAQLFEPGVKYSEAQVNLMLGQRHADTAALRRYMVDEALLDRGDGLYWRSGGTVSDQST
jgi:hypothetical protein